MKQAIGSRVWRLNENMVRTTLVTGHRGQTLLSPSAAVMKYSDERNLRAKDWFWPHGSIVHHGGQVNSPSWQQSSQGSRTWHSCSHPTHGLEAQKGVCCRSAPFLHLSSLGFQAREWCHPQWAGPPTPVNSNHKDDPSKAYSEARVPGDS